VVKPGDIKTVGDAKQVVLDFLPGTFSYNSEMVDMARQLVQLYSEAPASTKYHGSFPGGLLVHVACVMSLVDVYNNDMTPNKLALLTAAFFHDIGKLGRLTVRHSELAVQREYYKPNQTDQPNAPPFVRDTDLPDHVELAQYNLMQLSKLVDPAILYHHIDYPVWMAITYHNGAYGSNLTWPVKGNETSLMMHLHFYDMLASREYV